MPTVGQSFLRFCQNCVPFFANIEFEKVYKIDTMESRNWAKCGEKFAWKTTTFTPYVQLRKRTEPFRRHRREIQHASWSTILKLSYRKREAVGVAMSMKCCDSREGYVKQAHGMRCSHRVLPDGCCIFKK